MKRYVLILLIGLIAVRSWGQTCSGSLTSSTTTPCLNQPFTISTPFSGGFPGESITWEVGSTTTGPWTSVGTNTFSSTTQQASITITSTVSGVFYYRGVRAGCTFNTITITVGSGTPPSPSTVSSSVICSGVATLTAAGNGSGTYTWYKLNGVNALSQEQMGASAQYAIPTVPNGSFPNQSHTYYVTYSDGTCTSNRSNSILVLPAGVAPNPPSITAEATIVCSGKSTTLTAAGGTGTINWYRSNNGGSSIATGPTLVVTIESPDPAFSYLATSTVSTCQSVGSNFISVSAVAPTSIVDGAADENFVVSAVSTTTQVTGGCKLISQFTTSDPMGGEIYGATVNARVSFDATVQSYNRRPYVQRHYDFHPVNPLTPGYAPYYSPIMYFTQAEFDAFNAVSSAKLPQNPTDNAGVGRLRILHAYGTPNSLPAKPGNYSAGNVIEDCFPCQSVSWVASLNAWEVRINTRGFSGFFITAENAALPVTLTAFNAKSDEQAISLHWITAMETKFSHYEIQRSSHPKDGFERVGTVKSQGNASGGTYTFIDADALAGNWQYYRLRMVDLDGSHEYSKIIAARIGQDVAIRIFPNPAQTELTFTSAERVTDYQLISPSGQLIHSQTGLRTKRETVMLSTLPSGVYVLRLHVESGRTETRKVVVE